MGNFFVMSLFLFRCLMSTLSTTGRVRQLKDVSDISTIHNAQGHDKGHYARPRLHGGVSRDSGQLQLSRGLRKWQASHECHLRGPYINSSKQTNTTTSATTTPTTKATTTASASSARPPTSLKGGGGEREGRVCVLSVC